MARINIEDSFYRDHRFINLLQLGYRYYEALGLAVGAWSLAQKYYLKTEHGLIPHTAWDSSGFEVFEKVGLAERRENGVYMKGSEEQFAWLKQRSNAGKNSAQRSKNPNDRSTTVQRETTVEQPLTLTLTQDKKENIKKKKNSGSDEPSETDVSPPQILFWIWNENRGSLPEAVALTKQRESAARQRWKEVPDEEYWRSVVMKMSVSSFCCGENDRGWRADFDFFLKPSTHVKVAEGMFGYRPTRKNSTMGVIGG